MGQLTLGLVAWLGDKVTGARLESRFATHLSLLMYVSSFLIRSALTSGGKYSRRSVMLTNARGNRQ